MRKAFDFGAHKTVNHWFPQHMSKATNKILSGVQQIDCILEIHDARIPLTGRNSALSSIIYNKKRVLVFNKVDLAPEILNYTKSLKKYYRSTTNLNVSKVLFTSCGTKSIWSEPHDTIKDIIPECVKVIDSDTRDSRNCELDYNIMVLGIPNVGKSTILNHLRTLLLGQKHCNPTGKNPGVTKAVMNKVKVCDSPRVYLIDTPGVVNPRIHSLEEGMKLALCNTVSEHVLGNAMAADYLLFILNNYMQFQYVEKYKLKEPIDDIKLVLHKIALQEGKLIKRRILTGVGPRHVDVPNYENVAFGMLKDFREGKLGKFLLDNLSQLQDNMHFHQHNK